LEYIEKYNTYPIYPDHGRAFDAWPEIRMKACMKASKGDTLKVTELNEDDVPEAKRIANVLIDEHVKWLRKEFKLD
jgi:hypothetical protein